MFLLKDEYSTIYKKVIISKLAKKVLDLAAGTTISKIATKENFIKATNSAIGKQLTKVGPDKVDNVFEKQQFWNFKNLDSR